MKYAWVIPFAMGLFFLLSMVATFLSPRILTEAEGAVESLTGSTFSQLAASDPGVANYIYYLIRILAIFSAGLGRSSWLYRPRLTGGEKCGPGA